MDVKRGTDRTRTKEGAQSEETDRQGGRATERDRDGERRTYREVN